MQFDHDGFEAGVAQRERGVAAAIVEFDALPDPVRPAAEDHHLAASGRLRLALGRGAERGFVGRIHVRGRRGEFGRAGVDALVDRGDAQRGAGRRDLGFLHAGKRGEPRVGKAGRLEPLEIGGVPGQAEFAHAGFERDDVGEPLQEPQVDLGDVVRLGDAHAEPQRLGDLEQPVGRRLADRGAQGVDVVALAEALDLNLVEPGQSGLQRAQRLLQRFGEGAADRHRLAHRLHRGGQHRVGAGEFLEREARDFRHDVIDRRLERGRRRAAGDVVGDLVKGVADRELGRDLGDREPRRLGGERGGARHARVHLDHDHPPVGRVDRELHVRAAGLDADLAQHRQRGVAHDLVFFVGQRQRGRDRDGIAGVHAHRVDIFDRADDDAIVRLVADHLHLEFLPAEHAFFDQHLVGGRGVDAALDDVEELVSIIGDAAAGAPQREARPDDGGKPDVGQRLQRLPQRADVVRARRREADPGHRLAEPLPVLRLVDRVRRRADHLDVVLLQHAHLLEAQRAVQRRLAAHGRQKRESARYGVALDRDDLGHHFRRDRLDIGAVRHVGIGHDRGGVRIDEHDAVALGAQRLAGLDPGIVELAGLTDDDRARADDQNGGDVGPLRHESPSTRVSDARSRPGAPSRLTYKKGPRRGRLAARRPSARDDPPKTGRRPLN